MSASFPVWCLEIASRLLGVALLLLVLPLAQGLTAEDGQRLVLVTPDIDLVKAPGQREIPLLVKLKNASGQECKLTKVLGSCGCIFVDQSELGTIPAWGMGGFEASIDVARVLQEERLSLIIEASFDGGGKEFPVQQLTLHVRQFIKISPFCLAWAKETMEHRKSISVSFGMPESVSRVEVMPDQKNLFKVVMREAKDFGNSREATIEPNLQNFPEDLSGQDQEGPITADLKAVVTLRDGKSEASSIHLIVDRAYIRAAREREKRR